LVIGHSFFIRVSSFAIPLSRHMPPIRLLLDPPARGAWNMAVDEALLEAATRGLTTLRFYAWSEPTLSLGYFQAAADRRQHPASENCPLVRRASGGGAIVHDRELTYAFAVPIRQRLGKRAAALFNIFHRTLADTLGLLGVPARLWQPSALEAPAGPAKSVPFLCFLRRSQGDVLIGQHKIAGSAQRRQRGGLLQHGSILLARSASGAELPGIAELANTAISGPELVAQWQIALMEGLGLELETAELSAAERSRAAQIEQQRFAADEWTHRR
jgi:lipoate-protein ligase A